MSIAMNDEFALIMEVECDPKSGMTLPNTPPVAVGFGLYPRLDKKKTAEAGHEVYTDREYVKIVIPGDRFSEFLQPATDEYRRKFPKAYASFKTRSTEAKSGMPIEQWASITRSMAYMLKAVHVHTVEALAEMHDTNMARLGFNGRELREKARAWLRTSKDGAETMRLASEKQALQDELAAMKAQIAALQNGATGNRNAAPVPPTPPQIAADVEADVAAAARRPRRQ